MLLWLPLLTKVRSILISKTQFDFLQISLGSISYRLFWQTRIYICKVSQYYIYICIYMPVLSIVKSSIVSWIYEIVYYTFFGTRQVRGFHPCQCLNSTIFILVTTLSIKRNYIKGMLFIGSWLI